MKKIFTLISILSVSISGLWAQATPNPGFETWTTSGGFPSYSYPNSWDCPNSQTAITGTFLVVKATAAGDFHNGSAAVKLITKNVLSVNAPGIVTTGKLPTSTGGTITGGIPYTSRPDSIIGWYKYTPAGGDNGFFAFALLGAGGNTDTVGSAFWTTPTTTVGTYTRFAAAIIYKSANAVDTAVWVVCSSATGVPTSANVGSTLFADDLGVVINPTTSVAEQNNPDELTVFPNPSSGIFNLKKSTTAIGSENLKIKIYNVFGECVHQQIVPSVNVQIDLNSPDGLYFYSVMDENNSVVRSGKLVIQK